MQEAEVVCASRDWDAQLLYFTCSSLTNDDRFLFLISNKDGNPNIYRFELETNRMKQLSFNTDGYLRSYVYFDGQCSKGLGKASVSLDALHGIIYYLQDNSIFSTDSENGVRKLFDLPQNQVTAFTHVSLDGHYLCVPTTDARALEYDPELEGCGIDKRPTFDIDLRMQNENLSSYLHVFDIWNHKELFVRKVPKTWITHVQFNPTNPRLLLFNNEWPSYGCGFRRIWLLNGDTYYPIRSVNVENRTANDWVCHEMWSPDGSSIIYHGSYPSGTAFIGKYQVDSHVITEIPLDESFKSYGHFSVTPSNNLICDGYYKFKDDVPVTRENSTDNGPDPQKKTGEYISLVISDWRRKCLEWHPLCKHETNWLGQDTHPHPITNHSGTRIFFNAERKDHVGIYSVPLFEGEE
jgi:hypothetical protein